MCGSDSFQCPLPWDQALAVITTENTVSLTLDCRMLSVVFLLSPVELTSLIATFAAWRAVLYCEEDCSPTNQAGS